MGVNEEETISRQLTIGGGESLQLKHIFHIFHALQEEYPDIQLQYTSANVDDVFTKLDNGLLDFAITIGFVNASRYNHLLLPWADMWGLLLPQNHPLATQETIRASDLEDLPLLISEQSFVNNESTDWLGYEVDRLKIVGNYNLLFSASVMTQVGIGYALCLGGIIQSEKFVFRPLEPQKLAPLHLIWKKNQPLSHLAKNFLERLQVELSSQ